MRINIKDKSVCLNCKRKTCAMSDVVERVIFTRFKTERYTCPVRYLQTEPEDSQIDAGRIDLTQGSESGLHCIHCGLCVLQCANDNLEIVNEGDDNFRSFIDCSCAQNVGVANILATSFLNVLFDFAANTNLSKALLFDGIVCDQNGRYAYVEVDEGDDSLESCRRLLGDIVQHNYKNPEIKIHIGLMVLKSIPRAGNRDVVTLTEKMRKFPGTANIDIFVITFDILRTLCLKFDKNRLKFEDVFYNLSREEYSQYVTRMNSLGILVEG